MQTDLDCDVATPSADEMQREQPKASVQRAALRLESGCHQILSIESRGSVIIQTTSQFISLVVLLIGNLVTAIFHARIV